MTSVDFFDSRSLGGGSRLHGCPADGAGRPDERDLGHSQRLALGCVGEQGEPEISANLLDSRYPVDEIFWNVASFGDRQVCKQFHDDFYPESRCCLPAHEQDGGVCAAASSAHFETLQSRKVLGKRAFNDCKLGVVA